MTNSCLTQTAQLAFGPTMTRNSSVPSVGSVLGGVTTRPATPSHVAGASSVRGGITTRSRFAGGAP